jgi:hypothetical protein
MPELDRIDVVQSSVQDRRQRVIAAADGIDQLVQVEVTEVRRCTLASSRRRVRSAGEQQARPSERLRCVDSRSGRGRVLRHAGPPRPDVRRTVRLAHVDGLPLPGSPTTWPSGMVRGRGHQWELLLQGAVSGARTLGQALASPQPVTPRHEGWTAWVLVRRAPGETTRARFRSLWTTRARRARPGPAGPIARPHCEVQRRQDDAPVPRQVRPGRTAGQGSRRRPRGAGCTWRPVRLGPVLRTSAVRSRSRR